VIIVAKVRGTCPVLGKNASGFWARGPWRGFVAGFGKVFEFSENCLNFAATRRQHQTCSSSGVTKMTQVVSKGDLSRSRFHQGQFQVKQKPRGLSPKRLILCFMAITFILAGFGIWVVPAPTHEPGEALLRLATSLVLEISGLSLALWARLSR